jgi:hypothetical protein
MEQAASSRMIERRKKPRKAWAVRKDRGAVLEWKVDHRQTKGPEADPCARTYNLLQKLSVPGLALEDETPLRPSGRNPYDNARAPGNKKAIGRK